MWPFNRKKPSPIDPVECHGGRIWAENAVGAGAIFRFSVPAHAQPNAETPLFEREAIR